MAKNIFGDTIIDDVASTKAPKKNAFGDTIIDDDAGTPASSVSPYEATRAGRFSGAALPINLPGVPNPLMGVNPDVLMGAPIAGAKSRRTPDPLGELNEAAHPALPSGSVIQRALRNLPRSAANLYSGGFGMGGSNPSPAKVDAKGNPVADDRSGFERDWDDIKGVGSSLISHPWNTAKEMFAQDPLGTAALAGSAGRAAYELPNVLPQTLRNARNLPSRASNWAQDRFTKPVDVMTDQHQALAPVPKDLDFNAETQRAVPLIKQAEQAHVDKGGIAIKDAPQKTGAVMEAINKHLADAKTAAYQAWLNISAPVRQKAVLQDPISEEVEKLITPGMRRYEATKAKALQDVADSYRGTTATVDEMDSQLVSDNSELKKLYDASHAAQRAAAGQISDPVVLKAVSNGRRRAMYNAFNTDTTPKPVVPGMNAAEWSKPRTLDESHAGADFTIDDIEQARKAREDYGALMAYQESLERRMNKALREPAGSTGLEAKIADLKRYGGSLTAAYKGNVLHAVKNLIPSELQNTEELLRRSFGAATPAEAREINARFPQFDYARQNVRRYPEGVPDPFGGSGTTSWPSTHPRPSPLPAPGAPPINPLAGVRVRRYDPLGLGTEMWGQDPLGLNVSAAGPNNVFGGGGAEKPIIDLQGLGRITNEPQFLPDPFGFPKIHVVGPNQPLLPGIRRVTTNHARPVTQRGEWTSPLGSAPATAESAGPGQPPLNTWAKSTMGNALGRSHGIGLPDQPLEQGPWTDQFGRPWTRPSTSTAGPGAGSQAFHIPEDPIPMPSAAPRLPGASPGLPHRPPPPEYLGPKMLPGRVGEQPRLPELTTSGLDQWAEEAAKYNEQLAAAHHLTEAETQSAKNAKVALNPELSQRYNKYRQPIDSLGRVGPKAEGAKESAQVFKGAFKAQTPEAIRAQQLSVAADLMQKARAEWAPLYYEQSTQEQSAIDGQLWQKVQRDLVEQGLSEADVKGLTDWLSKNRGNAPTPKPKPAGTRPVLPGEQYPLLPPR